MRMPAPPMISGIRPGSLAAEAGVEAGDTLLTVAGQSLRDAVDLQFLQAADEVEVHIRKGNGLEEVLLFEKNIDEDLGFEFERPTWDDIDLCNNNCFFCFLKGLPKGLRKTLYTKDDDYRLSFLHGNFVTLTNLQDEDWARLEEQRLSPLNVSVHATGLELRRQMLNNDTAPDILEQLARLRTLGIQAHTQIVLCPGVNDGAELDRSLHDLVALYPTVQSVSVVPVGASPRLETWSRDRDGIELVRPTAEYARAVIEQVRPFQRWCRQRFGATVVQCSDEYYVTAGIAVPGRRTYDGLRQYENGIGMVRVLLDDWGRTKRRLATRPSPSAVRSAAIGAGTLIAPLLSGLARELEQLIGVRLTVVPVRNELFGERVNVSGLLPGEAFATGLAHVPAEIVILPRASLDYFGRQFLDDMTPAELSARLGRSVTFASLFSEVVEVLSHGPAAPHVNAASNGAMWSAPA